MYILRRIALFIYISSTLFFSEVLFLYIIILKTYKLIGLTNLTLYAKEHILYKKVIICRNLYQMQYYGHLHYMV